MSARLAGQQVARAAGKVMVVVSCTSTAAKRRKSGMATGSAWITRVTATAKTYPKQAAVAAVKRCCRASRPPRRRSAGSSGGQDGAPVGFGIPPRTGIDGHHRPRRRGQGGDQVLARSPAASSTPNAGSRDCNQVTSFRISAMSPVPAQRSSVGRRVTSHWTLVLVMPPASASGSIHPSGTILARCGLGSPWQLCGLAHESGAATRAALQTAATTGRAGCRPSIRLTAVVATPRPRCKRSGSGTGPPLPSLEPPPANYSAGGDWGTQAPSGGKMLVPNVTSGGAANQSLTVSRQRTKCGASVCAWKAASSR